ncbi:MAG: hypothetical protein ACOYT8_01050 [Candidatus Dependentiae bacterium]
MKYLIFVLCYFSLHAMEHPIEQFKLIPIPIIAAPVAPTHGGLLVDDLRRIEKLNEIAADRGLEAFRSSLSKYFKQKQQEDCFEELIFLVSALYAQHMIMGKIEAYSYLNMAKSSYYQHLKNNSHDLQLHPDGQIAGAIFDCGTVSAMAFCIQKKDLFTRSEQEIIKEIAPLYLSSDKQLISIAEAFRAYINSEKLVPLIDSLYQNYDKVSFGLVKLCIKCFFKLPFVTSLKEWYEIHEKKLKQKMAQISQKSIFDPMMLKLSSLSQQYLASQQQYIRLYENLYKTIKQLTDVPITNTIDPKQGSELLPSTLKEIKPIASILKISGYDTELERLIHENQLTLKQIKDVIQKQKKIKISDDGFVTAGDVTDSIVMIHDTRNNATLQLIKNPQNKLITIALPLIYAANVKEWLQSPQEAIKNQGYNKVGSRKYALTQQGGYDPILLHAFSILVDDYLPECATQTETVSRKKPLQKDILLTIAGSITDKNNKEMTGIFTYLIDSKTGVCYHRFFEPQLGTQLIKNFYEQGYFAPSAGGYYDIAFPSLSETDKGPK